MAGGAEVALVACERVTCSCRCEEMQAYVKLLWLLAAVRGHVRPAGGAQAVQAVHSLDACSARVLLAACVSCDPHAWPRDSSACAPCLHVHIMPPCLHALQERELDNLRGVLRALAMSRWVRTLCLATYVYCSEHTKRSM